MIEHVLPVHAFLRFMAWAALALAFAIAFFWLHLKARKASDASTHALLVRGGKCVAVACVLCAVIAIAGCGDTINPVRYQVQEVVITRPCLAGKTPPAQAVVLTDPVCTLPTNAECVRAAAADIAELTREARESRNLIRECSK